MLIEFKIQLEGNGTATVTQADAAPNPNAPVQKNLAETYVAPSSAAQQSVAKTGRGGDGPQSDPATGAPMSSGSGMVFVIGPIVICGSGPGHTGPGHTGPGGDGPQSDPATS